MSCQKSVDKKGFSIQYGFLKGRLRLRKAFLIDSICFLLSSIPQSRSWSKSALQLYGSCSLKHIRSLYRKQKLKSLSSQSLQYVGNSLFTIIGSPSSVEPLKYFGQISNKSPLYLHPYLPS